jgi:hypothetical protein
VQTDKGKTPEQKRNVTEADVKSVDGKSGQSLESSHNDKSHEKAGRETGAGGGKKQERHQSH